ncbi:hypothetical protein ACAG39_05120 [Caldicellulosiruptoraceae bacterium PP1]
MKYTGAISDADILINLAEVNRLDILELLFKEIIIPHTQQYYSFMCLF